MKNTYSVKGHEIAIKITKSAYDRKAVLFANNIIDELKKLNIIRDDVKIKTNILGNKNIPAVLQFWAGGHYLRFSFGQAKRFIDNLNVILKLVEIEVNLVLTGENDIHKFYNVFTSQNSQKEINKELKEAKKTLGIESDEKDPKIINDLYKKLARKHHPDLGGNLEEFQKINKAHKLIKSELGF